MNSVEYNQQEEVLLKKILSLTEEKVISSLNPIQKKEIVPIRQWLEDEYYVGRDGLRLYPFWKEQMIDIFEINKGKYTEIIIEGALGCSPRTAEYQTSKGLLTWPEIEKIVEEGEEVLVLSENGDYNKVLRAGSVGTKHTYRLSLLDGYERDFSEDHLLRVRDRKDVRWVQVKDLNPGDKVLKSIRKAPFPKERTLPRDITCRIGHSLGQGEPIPSEIMSKIEDKDRLIQGRFPKIPLSEKEVWEILLGITSSAGSFSRTSEGVDTWSLTLRNKGLIADTVHYLNSLGIKTEVLYSHEDEEGTNYIVRVTDSYSLFLAKLNLNSFIRVDYDKRIPYSYDQEEFYEVTIKSKEYLGKMECGDISVENDSTYITGGLVNHNTGKSTCGIYILIRKLYEMSCYENIQALYDLMMSASIVLMYFTISRSQAEVTGFGQFRDLIDSIPYFRKEFARDPSISSILKFPERVLFIQGSSCLSADSLIFTDKGIVRADQLTTEHKVWNGFEYAEVLEVWTEDNREFYRVTTDTGHFIDSVDNHLHPTQRGDVETTELEVGDTLQITVPEDFGSYQQVKLSCGMVIIDKRIDESLALYLGWEQADDSVEKRFAQTKLGLKSYIEAFSIEQGVPMTRLELADPESMTEKIMKSPFSVRVSYLRGLLSALPKTNNEVRLDKSLGKLIYVLLTSIGIVPKIVWGEEEERLLTIELNNKDLNRLLGGGWTLNSRFIETSVATIEKLPKAICYAARVEGEIYNANGILTHNTGHQIGLNLIASILDEANFFAQGRVADAAALKAVTSLHTSLINRGTSRFMSNGVNNSLSILISSPTYSSSYTQQRIEQAKENPATKVIKCRLWDVKKKGTYSEEMFHVFVGSEKLDPFLINSIEDVDILLHSEGLPVTEEYTIETAIKKLPPRLRELVDSVPIDFYENYEKNLIQSIQDISGFSSAPTGRLFSSRALLREAIDEDIPEIFSKPEMVIQTKDNSETNTLSYYLVDEMMNKDKFRYFHIDQSITTDSTGIACAHRSGEIEEEGQKLPIITLDFALRINPPKAPKKISISRLRNIILVLNREQGIPIGKVTYDSFASAESIEVLGELGYEAGNLSVDRNDDQYLEFISLLVEGRIKMSQQVHDLVASEIFDLIHYRERRKVDHSPEGSKDVMDACVGAVWNCLKAEDIQDHSESDRDIAIRVTSMVDRERDEHTRFILGDYFKDRTIY